MKIFIKMGKAAINIICKLHVLVYEWMEFIKFLIGTTFYSWKNKKTVYSVILGSIFVLIIKMIPEHA